MILIVTATALEVKPLLGSIRVKVGTIIPLDLPSQDDVSLLVTGVGAVPTAYHLGAILANSNISFVVNLGIAGTYNPNINIGDVTLVEYDTFADYGIDDNGEFTSLFDINLVDGNRLPYNDRWLTCNYISSTQKKLGSGFTRARGITVATASGSAPTIARYSDLYAPDIETMEGAAFFYACIMAGVPFASLRSISNRVEPRNTKNWNIPLAVKNLCNAATDLLSILP